MIRKIDGRAAGRSGSFPLTVMQQGMLVHAISGPGSGVDVLQVLMTLREDLDVEAFAAAWRRVLDRHVGLRASFRWEGLASPRQVLAGSVEMPVALEDWGELDPADRERRWRRFLESDRRRGFDVSRAPLMRLLIVRWGGSEYRVVWSFHHMLADGRSYFLVLKDLFEIYEPLRHRREPSLERPPPYERFLRWLEDRDPTSLGPFWRLRLEGFREPTPLPLEPRPRARSGDLEVEGEDAEELRLPREVVDGLDGIGVPYGLTLHTFVQGAWALMLNLYSSAGEVVFGSIRAARHGSVPGTDAMVGAFINNLPVRVGIEPGRRLIPWLGDLRAQAVALREGEHTPLPDIQRWSEVSPERRLFETVVSFERFNLDSRLRGLGGPWTHRSFRVLRQVGYPLSLGASLEPGGLLLSLSYARSRYRRCDAQRLLRTLAGVLRGMARHPESRLREVARLSGAVRSQILVEWNDTDPAEAGETPLTAGLDRQAAARPHAVAAVEGDMAVTYGDLHRSSVALARRLRRRGVVPEVLVALAMDRGIEQAVAQEAVWRAGGAVLPLSPSEPPERSSWILRRSRPRLILTSRSSVRRVQGLAPAGAPVLALEELVEEPDRSGGELARDAGPDSLAYVLFTSGSTGRPKGVMVRRGALARHVQTVAERYGVVPGDRVLQFAAPGFDVAMEELVPALRNGARAVFPPPEARMSVSAFADTLTGYGVTVAGLPASFWHEWVDHLDRSAGKLPESLRLVVAGSESVQAGSFERWRARFGDGVAFFHAYGLTEATITNTLHPADRRSRPPGPGPLPIGRPVAGCRAYVTDPGLDPVPLGAVGVLGLAGTGLARGYLRDPLWTAERFRPDPFAPEPGGRLYWTGDLARFRDDGSLEFLGRTDRQINVRGFRVEPGEIEAALAEHPGVALAAIAPHRDERGEGALVAYVVTAVDPAPDDDELRAFLEERLPAAMVPGSFVHLEKLPLTATGKVDRSELPDPGPEERSGAPPRTPLEALVASVWSEVLGRPEIGRDESFFALGGHSLSAARALSRLEGELGVRLPVRTLFEHPTVAGLAGEVESARRRESGRTEPVPLVPCPDPPLSFAQERLWILEQMGGAPGVYNVPLGLRLEGDLDRECLEQALTRIVARHEPLRSRFPAPGGRPRVEVAAEPRIRLPTVDLQGLSPEARGPEVERLRREEARRPFDLARGPLLRGLLLRLEERVAFAQLTVHHIAFDGGSESVFWRELGAVYAGRLEGRPDRLPDLPVRYGDFAAWQRRTLREERLDELLGYWRRRLAGCPQTLELPADRPRTQANRFTGAKLYFALPESASAAVTAVSRRRAVTPFMVVLAALAILTSRATGRTDLLLGAPVAHRDRRELEELIGLFVNLLALRVVVTPAMTGAELLDQVRRTVLEAYDHRDLPFERLVQELAEARDTEHAPLVQVVLAFGADRRAAPRLPGLSVDLVDGTARKTKFDLTLSLDETDAGFRGFLSYRSDLFAAVTARRLLGHFTHLLRGLAEDPRAPLEALSVLSPGERHQIALEWEGRERAYPREAGLAEVFEATVSKRPDAVALVGDGVHLTYGELDRSADRLAVALQRRGVGPGALVAVLTERSPARIVALLGILKAGGAYLPVDRASPDRRRRRMLADAGSRLLVAHRPDPPGVPDGLEVVVVGRDGAPAGKRPVGRAFGRDLAYVLYTSGSTGEPKGVAVEQRSVLRLVRGADYASFDPDETFLQFAPLSFDASTFEIWGPLLNGCRLVLFPERRVSLDALAKELVRSRVSTLWLTAALFHQMVDDHLPELAGLRQLLAGGDRLSPDHVRRASELLGSGVLTNGYGPTEGTTFTACHRVGPEVAGSDSVPIGRPISNTRIHVLGAEGRRLPIGVPGELWAGGDGVARGYWRRPKLTAASFRPDPFGAAPGGRLYRTGDRVRYRGDGALEFLGRVDDQVKVRGFRVEPGEIEIALAAHPAVARAVVVATEVGGGKDLVGYALPRQGAAPAPEALRGFLAESIPAYMIPSFLHVVPRLPVSATGKVDRGELVRRHPPIPPREDREPASLTPLESRVAEIWSAVLGVGGVGTSDDFFDLGGHSLKATQIVARVHEAMGVKLGLETVFRFPGFTAFCGQVERSLEEGRGAQEESAIVALPRRSRSRGGSA